MNQPNIPIWDNNSSFAIGSTPFGFYDSDPDFQRDADKVAVFCARRLGYPIVEIELQDINFYTAFEEAVTTYGNELYAYKVRDNQLSLEGNNTAQNINNALISPSFEPIIRLSEQYASEAGAGGNVEYKKGSIPITASIQDYDMVKYVNTGSNGIEVKRVYYESSPAIVRFYDPYSGTGFGSQNMFASLGFGSMSPAINFLMMPLNYDIQTIQQIEMNDMVRKSNYSFEIHNNKLRIFPIPSNTFGNIWFDYIERDERIGSSIHQMGTGSISNVSNVPYNNPSYLNINSIGRQWIFEYSLALCKEMLGYVRGKYNTLPVPNSTVTLNSAELIASATLEKTSLIERLRTYFDETSRKALLERRRDENAVVNTEMNNIPLCIYCG